MDVIVVQHIATNWTKTARGGANAVRRNRVPESLKIPLGRLHEKCLILLQQELFFYEGRLTVPREKITINPAARPLTVGCVTVNQLEDQIAVRFRYDRVCGGAPDRGWTRKSHRVIQNQWAQIVYNGRFTGEDYWWYEKHTVNIGLFERLTSGIFTRCEPTYRFEALAELF